MNRSNRALALLLICATSLSARADLATPSPSASGSSGPFSRAQCDQFCSALVSGDGKIKGLSGGAGWTTTDDQWCANHNAQTNPAITANPNPSSSLSVPNGTCNIALQSGDTSCADNQARYAHCQWHNGQAEQQCEAYVAAGGANSAQKVVLVLDLAAAATCAAECAMPAKSLSPAVVSACRLAGASATATEIIETLAMKSSAVAKVMGLAGSGFQAYQEYGAVKSAGGLGNFASGKTVADGKASTQKDKNVCISALVFAAMAMNRYSSIHSADGTKGDACSALSRLASNTSLVGGGTIITLPGSDGVSGSGTTSGSTGTTATNRDASLRCVGSGGTVASCTGTNAAAASDSGILSSSGLGQHVAHSAEQLANSPLGQALGEGKGDPMAALGQLTSGTGDAGGAVMTVAAAALAHPEAMADGVTGTAMGGGGGGAPSGGGEAAPNPMAALAALLNPQQKDQMPAGGAQNFKGGENTDIWHRNSDQNLFQIVSGRIEKVSAQMR